MWIVTSCAVCGKVVDHERAVPVGDMTGVLSDVACERCAKALLGPGDCRACQRALEEFGELPSFCSVCGACRVPLRYS